MSFIFPSSAFIPLVLSKFLAEHGTGQFRLPILVAPCWKEAFWLPTGSSMLKDIPLQCPIVKDLIMDALVGQVFRSLHTLHLNLWLLRDVCCTDKVSFPQSVRQWWRHLKCSVTSLKCNNTDVVNNCILLTVYIQVYI